jgi:hypothetical protein
MPSSKDSRDKPLKIRYDHWDLVSAISLIRDLQPKAHKLGYNLTLGGGVLNNGWSGNDLDIVAIPRGIPQDDPLADLHYALPDMEKLVNLCGVVVPGKRGPRPAWVIEAPSRLVYTVSVNFAKPPVDLIIMKVGVNNY